MIPFDLVYFRPETIKEAADAFSAADGEGLKPRYLGGGTEIVSFARRGLLKLGAVIDLKRIGECRVLEKSGTGLIFGAALTLNEVVGSDYFPLLSQAAKIVDHTIRNRLTLGGNIAGMLPYRETVLPLLLTKTGIRLAGPDGERTVPLNEVFSRRLKLKKGEFLVQLRVPAGVAELSCFRKRKTKTSRLDYPLLSLCAVETTDRIKTAVSGVFDAPVRSEKADAILNDGSLCPEKRAEKAAGAFKMTFKDDQRGSAAYRRMLLEKALEETVRELGGEK